MKKLAIITTHPIQYYAPVFKLLQSRGIIAIKVFYTLGEENFGKNDPGFGKNIQWDIPLLDGYNYQFVNNTSHNPGSAQFKGIRNPTLVPEINDWQPDAILVYGWAYNSHLKALKYFKDRIPVFFRGDSTLLNEQKGIRSFIKTLFLKWVYSHVDHAFYVGQNNKAYYKKYGLKDSQLTFATHAIDNDRFKDDRQQEADDMRSSLGITPEDIVVLFAGKFDPVKNVALLLSAFITLNKTNVHLLLVGNGVLEHALKGQASTSSMASNIHFIDFVNQTDMPVIYHAADVFCLPSKSESWGLSINEAMACSKAVLVSDKCGAAIDLVEPGKNGELFKSGDPDDILQKLQQLTKNKQQLADLGQNSFSIINERNFLSMVIAVENKMNNGNRG